MKKSIRRIITAGNIKSGMCLDFGHYEGLVPVDYDHNMAEYMNEERSPIYSAYVYDVEGDINSSEGITVYYTRGGYNENEGGRVVVYADDTFKVLG